MAEFIFFSDTHLGLDEPQKPRSSRLRRGPDFFANFHRVLDEARRRRVAGVIHGGDLFFRSKVPQPIVDRVYEDIHEFLESGIPLFLVPGNHERSRLPVSLFLAHPLLNIFHEPRTVVLPLNEGLLAVGGFPSVRNGIRDTFLANVASTGLLSTKADFRLLCMHQTTEGAHVGPGHFVFRGGPDVIPLSVLPSGIDGVLAGHIHRRQIHSYPDPTTGRAIPILFPGSIERTSFAERGETKGYFLLRIGRPSTSGCLEWEFQELPARPMVVLPDLPAIAPHQLTDWLRQQLRNCPERAIIRFRIPTGFEQAYQDCRNLFPPDAIIEYRNDHHRSEA